MASVYNAGVLAHRIASHRPPHHMSLHDGVLPNRGMIVVHPNHRAFAHATPMGLSWPCWPTACKLMYNATGCPKRAPHPVIASSNDGGSKGQAVTIANMSMQRSAFRAVRIGREVILKENALSPHGILSCFDFELIFPFFPVIIPIKDRTSWPAVH